MQDALLGLEDRLHGLTVEEVGARLVYGSFLADDARYIFLETPKAACSTLKWILADIENRPVAQMKADTAAKSPVGIHARNVHHLANLTGCDASQLQTLLDDDAVTRFCVVRNPYARLLSAWANKIRQGEPGFRKVWEQVALHSGGASDQCPTFAQFVAWLTDTQDVMRCDGHWRGMTWLLLPDLLRYTHVVKLEALAAGLAPVLARIAPGRDVATLLATHSSNESLPLPDSETRYDEETAARVFAFYREDFARYGYAADSWQQAPVPLDDEQAQRRQQQHAERLQTVALKLICERNQVIDGLINSPHTRAADTVRRFCESNSDAPDLLRDLGAAVLAGGHPERARTLLEAALQLRPQGAWIRLQLARCLIACNATEAAREHLNLLAGHAGVGKDAQVLLATLAAP